MTTATRPLPPAACRLAFERAAVSGHAPRDWQEAVDGVGGQSRARALLELVPRAAASPGALIVAHAAARLLDPDFDGPTAPT